MMTEKITGDSRRITAEDLQGYESLAAQFARRSLLPMFEGEHRDGNPGRLPEIFKTALATGIASSPDPSMPGYDYGIWGKASEAVASTLLLRIIAETCGGVAMGLNVQGAACNLLVNASPVLGRMPEFPAVAFQEGPWPIGITMDGGGMACTGVEASAVRRGGGYVVNGRKSYVYGMREPDAYLVLANSEKGAGIFIVYADTPGLEVIDAGWRTGLMACAVRHITCRNVEVPAENRLGGDAQDLVAMAMALTWIGQAAVLSGIARGAIRTAEKYISERYQGGKIIDRHPAVRGLIAGAEARTELMQSALNECGHTGNTVEMLRRAALLKLNAAGLGCEAVTDCLQVFGGYGYMEDFGMEKRLRDARTIACAMGSPVYLQQLIFELGRR
jgi:butyryl-CoA dehydrogenase